MLSRARHGMVVLGNAATLRAAQLRGAGMWGQVLDILDKDGCVGSCLKVSDMHCVFLASACSRPSFFSARDNSCRPALPPPRPSA